MGEVRSGQEGVESWEGGLVRPHSAAGSLVVGARTLVRFAVVPGHG